MQSTLHTQRKKSLILKMEGATKKFGNLIANDNVNFELRKGEIHALLGENGAGKSTLMNCLYGIFPLTKGKIFLNGKEIVINNTQDAIKYGIGMVHQHFMLIEQLTVTENIILGTKQKGPWLDVKTVEKEIKELSDKYRFNIDPQEKIKNLTVGMQQRVEILKTLYRNADIMIFDEATAVLTPQEVNQLFGIIRRLVNEGKSIIMITHKLEEVMEICDRVTVLRNGRMIGSLEVKDTSPRKLANMMVGRDVVLDIARKDKAPGDVALEIKDIVVKDRHGKHLIDGITVQLRKGEILGIAGIDGNGQIELSGVLTGMIPAKQGKVKIGDDDVSGKKAKHFIDKGFPYSTGSAKTGLIMEFSVMENLILQEHSKSPFCHFGIMNWKEIRRHADNLISEYQIKVPNASVPAKALSGGNQQKVILAREIDRQSNVLIAVQPTRGLDIGATEYVRSKILEQRDKGIAVLLISTELDEILALSDRIAVMYKGKFVDVFKNGKYSREQIGLMMSGVTKDVAINNVC